MPALDVFSKHNITRVSLVEGTLLPSINPRHCLIKLFSIPSTKHDLESI